MGNPRYEYCRDEGGDERKSLTSMGMRMAYHSRFNPLPSVDFHNKFEDEFPHVPGFGSGSRAWHEAFWELTGFGVVGTPKLSELGARAIPGWVTHWEVALELLETKPYGQRGGPKRTISCCGGVDPEHEAFWELTGFGVVGTPKLSELRARAIPGWVTHWEVARELPETKSCGQRGGPKRTISCYGGVDPGVLHPPPPPT
ncbi:hypothetical protein L3X38_043322 [Prunus dulcis]|uniref:Uncharacterized protein n=1 Tax=Prunus dulcis TaxID=3755 RepID=A0AAD4UYC1_PRUDU|nr:hypothetical protein L3X38_043322 [Prunus dulcis]